MRAVLRLRSGWPTRRIRFFLLSQLNRAASTGQERMETDPACCPRTMWPAPAPGCARALVGVPRRLACALDGVSAACAPKEEGATGPGVGVKSPRKRPRTGGGASRALVRDGGQAKPRVSDRRSLLPLVWTDRTRHRSGHFLRQAAYPLAVHSSSKSLLYSVIIPS